jgi:kinesin family protein 1
MDSEKPAAIRLSGDNILQEHCYFENIEGKVVMQSLPDSVTVRNFYYR